MFRRWLILAILLAPTQSMAWRKGDPSPQGRVVSNLGAIAPSVLMPFINQQKVAVSVRFTISGTDYDSTTPPGQATSAWAYLDSNGQPVAPLPVGTTTVRYGSFYLFASQVPVGFTRVGVGFKATWDGSASSVAVSSGSNVVAGANSMTWDWASDGANVNITFTTPSLSDPPRNLKVFVAAYESRLNAGETFDPVWLQYVKQAGNIYRYMDWGPINGTFNINRVTDIAPYGYFSWGRQFVPGVKGGIPLEIIKRLSNEANKHPWVNIWATLGTYKIWKVTGWTKAAQATITAPGHTFINGDKVILFGWATAGPSKVGTGISIDNTGLVTWTAHGMSSDQSFAFTGGTIPSPALGSVRYFVVSSGLTANTFRFATTVGGVPIVTGTGSSITVEAGASNVETTVANAVPGVSFDLSGPGQDTTFVNAYSGSFNVWATLPYNLSTITTEVTSLATYFRDNLNNNLVARYEFVNEPWNSGPSFGQYYWLQGQAYSDAAQATSTLPGNPMRMYGYLSAHIMKTISDVYGTAGAGRWKGIFGTQAVTDTSPTSRGFTGAQTYMTQFGIAGTIGALYNNGYLAVTGYWNGTFSSANVATTNQWPTDSIARYNAGLEPNQYSYFIRLGTENARTGSIFPGPNDFSIATLKTIWAAQKAIGLTNGFALTQYEGGAHDNLASSQAGDATMCDFWSTMRYSQEYSFLYKEMFQAFLDAGGVGPSKYVDATGPSCAFGSWGGMQWLGGGAVTPDINPVWNQIINFNYLLRRDIDRRPANDNDHTPMFVDKAA